MSLAAQPSTGVGELINLGIGPEKKKKRVPVVPAAPKKIYAPKAQIPKGEKKRTRRFSESWCDYIVVSDTLEGLAPVALRKPSQERSLRISRIFQRRTLMIPLTWNQKPIPYVRTESPSVFNDDLPPSPPRASIKEQLEGTKAAEAEAERAVEVEKPIEVEAEKVVEAEVVDAKPKSPEVVAQEPEKEKSIQEDPVITIPFSSTTSSPVNVENSPSGVKFQEGRSHDQTYHAYLEETTSSTSTTHHIVREWRSKVALLRAKLGANQAKFEREQKTEEWSAAGWKRKVESEAALLLEERKRWREICEKDNSEKMGLRNNINNLKVEIEKLKKEKIEAEAARC
ncbi:hypothetical protein Hanom_Chr03g00208331 [Helianthus anomalus]